MIKRERLTVAEVANFFDELAQEYLDPFNWDPNPELPHAQRKTYTIKEFFKAKYHNRVCLYYKDEIDVCRVNFHEIFSGNLIYLSQIDDIKHKIKIIVNADNFAVEGTMIGTTSNTSSLSTSATNHNTATLDSNNGFGSFKGDLDAAQLPSGLDKSRKIIETKQILEKSDTKIMDYLIPSRNVQHNVSLEKRHSDNTNTFTANNNTTNSASGNRSMTHRKGARAMQEIQSLSIRLRQIRAEFIEQFNPLFHLI